VVFASLKLKYEIHYNLNTHYLTFDVCCAFPGGGVVGGQYCSEIFERRVRNLHIRWEFSHRHEYMLLTGVRDESKVNLPPITAVKSCMLPNLLILLYIRSQDLVGTGY